MYPNLKLLVRCCAQYLKTIVLFALYEYFPTKTRYSALCLTTYTE